MKKTGYIEMMPHIFEYALKNNYLEPIIQRMIYDGINVLAKKYQELLWKQNFYTNDRDLDELSYPRFFGFELMELEKSFVAVNWIGEYDFMRYWEIDDSQWGEEINWTLKRYSAIINSENMRVFGCIESDFYDLYLSRENKDAPIVKYDSKKLSIIHNGAEVSKLRIPQNYKTK